MQATNTNVRNIITMMHIPLYIPGQTYKTHPPQQQRQPESPNSQNNDNTGSDMNSQSFTHYIHPKMIRSQQQEEEEQQQNANSC